MHTFRGHKDVVTTLAVSEEGDRVYSAGGDATICMWQIPQLDMPLYPAYSKCLVYYSILSSQCCAFNGFY